jgi:hypothetical protein
VIFFEIFPIDRVKGMGYGVFVASYLSPELYIYLSFISSDSMHKI